MKKRVFISNYEGPISRNESTLEITKHFIPEGDRIYNTIAKYCYINNHLSKKKDPRIANVSKLVLPFLIAFDANNKNVEDFCASNLVLRTNSKEALNYLKNISNAYIFGTSYEHLARAICRETDFPLENVFATKVNLDTFSLTTKEKSILKSFAWEIGSMPPMRIPLNIQSLKDLSSEDQELIKRLDKIFWKEILKMQCKKLLSDVNVIGEVEKTYAVQNIVKSLSSIYDDVMYVGNDPTDVGAMTLVASNGGFSVSYIGDKSTVRIANAAVLSSDYIPISVLADIFLRFGKLEAHKIAGNFEKDILWLTGADSNLLKKLFELHPMTWPKVYVVSDWNRETVVNQVEEFKKSVQDEEK